MIGGNNLFLLLHSLLRRECFPLKKEEKNVKTPREVETTKERKQKSHFFFLLTKILKKYLALWKQSLCLLVIQRKNLEFVIWSAAITYTNLKLYLVCIQILHINIFLFGEEKQPCLHMCVINSFITTRAYSLRLLLILTSF